MYPDTPTPQVARRLERSVAAVYGRATRSEARGQGGRFKDPGRDGHPAGKPRAHSSPGPDGAEHRPQFAETAGAGRSGAGRAPAEDQSESKGMSHNIEDLRSRLFAAL